MRPQGLRVPVLVLMFEFVLTTGVAIAQNRPTLVSQTATQSASDVHSTGPDTANVGQDTAVITMDGFCESRSEAGATEEPPCQTVITRAEFEKLAEASGATTPAARNQFAAFYVRYLLFAREAQKQGMEKDPRFQRKLELYRIQLLGQMLLQALQAKSEQFAPDDLEKFFRENPAQFEQFALLRVYVPRTKYSIQPNGVQDPIAATAPEMKIVAEKMYARARAGEDFKTIQKEAFEVANLKEEPVIELGKMSRSHLRHTHQFVFDLKPGEVSALIEEPEEGYYVYKVLSKDIPSFESVKTEVQIALQKQRMDAWMKNITGSRQTKLNERYFGPGAAKSGRGQ